MAFKLKDLMIDVLPGAQGAQAVNPAAQCPIPSAVTHLAAGIVCPIPSAHTTLCPYPSAHYPCPIPSAQIVAQGICPMFSAVQPSLTCAAALAQPTDGTHMANLAILKQQLQQALDQVNQHEAAVHAAAKPQTVEEAEALETQLQGALAELQAHKADLQKKQPMT